MEYHWGRSRGCRGAMVQGALVLVAGVVPLVPAGAMPAAVDTQQSATAVTSLVFDSVTVVDVEHGELVPAQRVVVVGNRIEAVGDVGAVQTPTRAQVVDARGKYLIPGLWDLHTHSDTMAHVFYPLFIANGVTGIRDASSSVPLDTLVQWRREILAGTRVGPPRQLLNGQSIDENPACVRTKELHTCVTDAADARHLVDSLKAAGADMVKTYSLSDKMYFAVVAAGRRAGLLIGGHTPVPAIAASDSGARLIDHTTHNRELEDRCFYGEAASVEQCRPVAERLARNGTWWVPTWFMPPATGRARTSSLYTYFNEFASKFWADSASYGSLYDYLRRAVANTDVPPQPDPFIARFPRPTGGTTPDTAGYMYVARNAGLLIMAGTDVLGRRGMAGGFALHVELATYEAEGLTPLEALQTATLNPAKFLHGTDSLGTVTPGKLADLVLLDANPLVDIRNTTTIRAVVANGRYFDRAALDQLLTDARAKANQQP